MNDAGECFANECGLDDVIKRDGRAWRIDRAEFSTECVVLYLAPHDTAGEMWRVSLAATEILRLVSP